MKKTCCCIAIASSLTLSAACGPDSGVADPSFDPRSSGISASATRFSEWSAPVNLGSVVNSSFNDAAPEMSKDGLSLYFGSNRPGGSGGNDIWVSRRASTDDPWGVPVNLGEVINGPANESGSHLSRDGHWLFFTSNRAGGFGGNDLYASWRANIHDDFAWETPRNLGEPLNSARSDLGPSIWGPEFHFWRGEAGTNSLGDLYMSRMVGNSFSDPVPVTKLNSAVHDEKPSIRFDGRELVFTTRRGGSLDLWFSTRDGNGHEWGDPEAIAILNTSFEDRRPTLSADGTMLFFDSNREGGFGAYDIYMSVRSVNGHAPRR